MRGVSEVISAVIIASAILAISLSGYLFVTYYNELSRASIEYGYIKSVFKSITQTSLGQVFRLEYRYPYNYLSLGYSVSRTNITISVSLEGGGVRNLTISNLVRLTAGVRKPIVNTPSIIYGDNTSLIQPTKTPFLIYEYYSNGWSRIVVDPSIIGYEIVNITSPQGTRVEVYFTLVNFTGLNNPTGPPEIYGQGYLVLSHDPSRDIAYVFTGVSGVKILYNNSEIAIPKQVADIFSSRASITLVVRIINIGVLIG
ncbi:hypothetical protein ACSU1N_00715 [Thermogladius sp. 4427co]|uniref:hypothetical protein n=1 Tax=Thermogladius sp. 4427co TaxID=3450718 RepID=UPI003F79932E